MKVSTVSLIVLATCFWAQRAAAQVVREEGTKSVAGLLSAEQPTMGWKFDARAGDILFVSLDAEIYLTAPGGGEGEDSGGCGGGGGGCEEGVNATQEGGCEGEGGPGHFFIAVLDNSNGQVICRAERPAPPPGWQRDPRLACVLPAPASGRPGAFTLQVGLNMRGEEPVTGTFPFLVDFSLRSVAPNGVLLQEAIARSHNQL